MTQLTEDQARDYMHKLLAAMVKAGGSDLFIAHDYPPSIKANGQMTPLSPQKLTGAITVIHSGTGPSNHNATPISVNPYPYDLQPKGKTDSLTVSIRSPGTTRQSMLSLRHS